MNVGIWTLESGETWEETECKAKVALESKLNLPFDVQIECAYRTGKAKSRQANASNSSSKRSRTVICRLVKWKQKNYILKAARTVEPDDMFVNEDLCC